MVVVLVVRVLVVAEGDGASPSSASGGEAERGRFSSILPGEVRGCVFLACCLVKESTDP